MTDHVAVIQADRDAVQAFHRTMAARLMADIKSKDHPKLGEDEGDAGTLVQAFARHRLAALNTRPDVEAMREACARHMEERGNLLLNTSTNLSAGTMMKAIFDAEAAAIRSIPVPTSGEGA